APSLTFPDNSHTFRNCDSVSLSWGGASGASEYYAQLATDSAFGSPIANSTWTSGTTWDATGSTSIARTYYWRVKSRNAWGESHDPTWSETRSFIVNANQ